MTKMLRSVLNGQGYRRSDNRSSGGKLEESDVLSCFHCQRLLDRRLWQQDGGMCHRCDAPVCGPCADRIPQFGCEIFIGQLEAALEKRYHREQNARALGLDT